MIERWHAVDEYIASHLISDDPVDAIAANAAAGLPTIDVSAAQGKLLHLLARMARAKRVLEIGTLGGYSTIWLARAVGDHGSVTTLERDPHHAEVARRNVDAAGIGARVDIRGGLAIDTLHALEGPFDLVFIDADKQNNAAYAREAIRLTEPGATIIVDNVIREGAVLDEASEDPRVVGTRALFEVVGAEPRLSATAVQTVGAKKWDGLLLAVREPD